ncbi:hypothetical protein LTR37_002090 [Vermiconidia calcicola]|uniref:Uncharacterized protein n=1 Tax=Vermiconidia calcicola TaxID=1690605 RepID=A0ACC3NV05_9PEZI|nr:hypothetical protein LTR37_002090 [Vermiconidia calcicola]
MQTRIINSRPEPERSQTWPPTLHNETAGEPGSKSALPQSHHVQDFFQDDLEDNPQNHFLSSIEMYSYEDWADDSDSDDEEVEWNAGINDFALFDNDRRRAQENNEPLPSKWNNMLDQQASALQRAVERTQEEPKQDGAAGSSITCEEDVPYLTPDRSPELRDDLDVESYHGQTASRPQLPKYLTIIVTPPEENNDQAVEEDENLPLSIYVARRRARSQPKRKLERPGLRHTRTMSGRIHSWQRPSHSMYTVGEDSEAEEKAEHGGGDEDEMRGRRSRS